MEQNHCVRCSIAISADDFSGFWQNFSEELQHVCMRCSLKFLKKTRHLEKAEVLKWLYSDCDETELREWIETSDRFEDAMSWRVDGFTPEIARGWMAWKCTPQQAEKLISSVEFDAKAPAIEFKKFGIALQEAFLFQSEGISVDKDCDPEDDLGTWLRSGLKARQIIKLRNQIFERLESLEEVWWDNWSTDQIVDLGFWKSLPQTFTSLLSLGLAINANNVLLYWGLTPGQILNLIDAGAESELAAMAIRRGVSIKNLTFIEKLVEDGFTHEFAIVTTGRGLLPKHRLLIEKRGWNLEDVYELLESDSNMQIDEVLKWLEFGIEGLQAWRKNGFTPESAREWQKEKFKPAEARAWELSGVKSPSVAKRRHEAGIRP